MLRDDDKTLADKPAMDQKGFICFSFVWLTNESCWQTLKKERKNTRDAGRSAIYIGSLWEGDSTIRLLPPPPSITQAVLHTVCTLRGFS